MVPWPPYPQRYAGALLQCCQDSSNKVWREIAWCEPHSTLPWSCGHLSLKAFLLSSRCNPLLLNPSWAKQLEELGRRKDLGHASSLGMQSRRVVLRFCYWAGMHTHSNSREEQQSICCHSTYSSPHISHFHNFCDHALLTRLGVSTTEEVLWFLPSPLPETTGPTPVCNQRTSASGSSPLLEQPVPETYSSNRASINSASTNHHHLLGAAASIVGVPTEGETHTLRRLYHT